MEYEDKYDNTKCYKMNIILVHGAWADESIWSKAIPILQDAGHRVIAVHLPFHSLADDVRVTNELSGIILPVI